MLKISFIGACLFLLNTSLFGAMDLTGVTFNTADATSVGLLVLTAVAVIWGIRKAISMGNKG